MKRLSSTDRKALIRLASAFPKGSEERKVILAGLEKQARLHKGQKYRVRYDGARLWDRNRNKSEYLKKGDIITYDGSHRGGGSDPGYSDWFISASGLNGKFVGKLGFLPGGQGGMNQKWLMPFDVGKPHV